MSSPRAGLGQARLNVQFQQEAQPASKPNAVGKVHPVSHRELRATSTGPELQLPKPEADKGVHPEQ